MRLRPQFALRIALVGDLLFFHLAMILFVVLPIFGDISTNPFTLLEAILGGIGIFLGVGLFGRLFSKPHIPFNEWAYLAVGCYALLSLAIFWGVIVPDPSLPTGGTVVAVVTVIYVSGIFGAGAAHIVDGTSNPILSRINRRYCEEWVRRRGED